MQIAHADIGMVATLCGLGIAALGTALSLAMNFGKDSDRSPEAGDTGETQDWPNWLARISQIPKPLYVFLLIWLGSGLLWYTLGIVYHHVHPTAGDFGKIAKDANLLVTLMLGVLGLVMTIVTLGVINISQKAVSDIGDQIKHGEAILNSFTDQMESHKQQIKKYDQRIRRGHDEIQLVQTTIALLPENQAEIRAGLPKEAKKMREVLDRIYTIPDHAAFLRYLSKFPGWQTLKEHLSTKERGYIAKLVDYYDKGEGSEQDDAAELRRLAIELTSI